LVAGNEEIRNYNGEMVENVGNLWETCRKIVEKLSETFYEIPHLITSSSLDRYKKNSLEKYKFAPYRGIRSSQDQY